METIKKVVITKLHFRDLIDVFDLGNKIFTSNKWINLYRTWNEYEILERFMSDEKYCIVAKYEKKIIGFALGAIIEKEKNPWNYGYLLWMGVDPAFVKSGVGKKLLNNISRLFKKDGVKIIMIDTASDNTGALKFFEKNGFEEEGKHVFLSKNLFKKHL